jgi:purine-binding chemotaxis protein CheW
MGGNKKLVDGVVQDYLDSMLQDMLLDTISPVIEELASPEKIAFIVQPSPRSAPIEDDPAPVAPVFTDVVPSDVAAPVERHPLADVPVVVEQPAPSVLTPAVKIPVAEMPIAKETVALAPITEVPQEIDVATSQPMPPDKPLRYPQAPVWAQMEFDCLLFDVCGLKLAVPMEMLGRIIKLDQELNFIIGKPDWFLGVLNDNEYRLSAIDTALYIMPEKGKRLSDSGFTHLLQLQRSNWTLACSKVYHTVRIHPNDVKWRSINGKRQWLAGTVIQHMCALIQVDTMIKLLDTQQDPNV